MNLLCYTVEKDYLKHFSIKLKIEIRGWEEQELFLNIGEKNGVQFNCSLHHRGGGVVEMVITMILISSAGRAWPGRCLCWQAALPHEHDLVQLLRPGLALDEVKTAALVQPPPPPQSSLLIGRRAASGGGGDGTSLWFYRHLITYFSHSQPISEPTRSRYNWKIFREKELIIYHHSNNPYQHKWYK